MQTITFTKRSVMNRLETWADDLNRMYRGSPSVFAIPGVTVTTWQPGAEDVLEIAPAAPYVGQPATVRWYTDRTACTVVAVSKTGHKVTVREDKAIRTDTNGMSECQSYAYEENPEGREFVYYRNAEGLYLDHGSRLVLGARSAYHDYSF